MNIRIPVFFYSLLYRFLSLKLFLFTAVLTLVLTPMPSCFSVCPSAVQTVLLGSPDSNACRCSWSYKSQRGAAIPVSLSDASPWMPAGRPWNA